MVMILDYEESDVYEEDNFEVNINGSPLSSLQRIFLLIYVKSTTDNMECMVKHIKTTFTFNNASIVSRVNVIDRK